MVAQKLTRFSVLGLLTVVGLLARLYCPYRSHVVLVNLFGREFVVPHLEVTDDSLDNSGLPASVGVVVVNIFRFHFSPSLPAFTSPQGIAGTALTLPCSRAHVGVLVVPLMALITAGLAMMVADMVALGCSKLKVLRSVIIADEVDMVNSFPPCERTPKNSFHDKAVLLDVTSIKGIDEHVASGFVSPSLPAWVSWPCASVATANSATKAALTSITVPFERVKHLAALFTGIFLCRVDSHSVSIAHGQLTING